MLGMLVVQACSSPKGLPKPEQLGYHTKGGHINVKMIAGGKYSGELIASYPDKLFVLLASENDTSLQEVSWDDVKSFALYYAEGKNQNWRIPVYSLATIFHGFFLIFTLPVNLVSTSIMAYASRNEYSFREEHLPREKIQMFARFPQGIPDGVSKENIR